MLEMMMGTTKKKSSRIKKVSNATTFTVSILTEDGRLYTRGSSNLTGTGSTATIDGDWQLTDNGVVDFVMFTGGLLYLKQDRTWWITGSSYAFDTTSEYTLTLRDVTSRFSALPADVAITKFVTGFGNTFVLMANGDVYGIGSEQLGMMGTAGTGKVTTATLMEVGGATGFSTGDTFTDIGMSLASFRSVYFLSAAGVLYGRGHGANGQLGSTTTATSNPVAKVIARSVTSFKAGAVCVYYQSGNVITGFGSYKYGQLAYSIYGNDDTRFSTTGVGLFSAAATVDTQWHVGINRIWYRSNAVWRYLGYSGTGVGSTTALPSDASVKTVTAGMEFLVGADIVSLDPNLQTSFAILDGVLYGTGFNNQNANILPGVTKGTNSNVFVALDMTGVS